MKNAEQLIIDMKADEELRKKLDDAVGAVFQKDLRIRKHRFLFRFVVAEAGRTRPHHRNDLFIAVFLCGFQCRKRSSQTAQLQGAVEFDPVDFIESGSGQDIRDTAAADLDLNISDHDQISSWQMILPSLSGETDTMAIFVPQYSSMKRI